MISSMTAFATRSTQEKWGSITVEIRSLNHRFLDISFRLPELLRSLEMDFRSYAQSILARGKIECVFRVQFVESENASVVLNHNLVKALVQAHQQAKQLVESDSSLKAQDIDLSRILFWPSVLQVDEKIPQNVFERITSVYQEALQELIHVREREGKSLVQLMASRFSEIQQLMQNVKKQLPSIKEHFRKLLVQKFQDAQLTLDPNRFEQEMVLYAQKIDVSEEIDRIEIHLKEALRMLNDGKAIGRRMDFLLQELNREINTLSVKSPDSDVTKDVLDIKVLLEQIREQTQNIE